MAEAEQSQRASSHLSISNSSRIYNDEQLEALVDFLHARRAATPTGNFKDQDFEDAAAAIHSRFPHSQRRHGKQVRGQFAKLKKIYNTIIGITSKSGTGGTPSDLGSLIFTGPDLKLFEANRDALPEGHPGKKVLKQFGGQRWPLFDQIHDLAYSSTATGRFAHSPGAGVFVYEQSTLNDDMYNSDDSGNAPFHMIPPVTSSIATQCRSTAEYHIPTTTHPPFSSLVSTDETFTSMSPLIPMVPLTPTIPPVPTTHLIPMAPPIVPFVPTAPTLSSNTSSAPLVSTLSPASLHLPIPLSTTHPATSSIPGATLSSQSHWTPTSELGRLQLSSHTSVSSSVTSAKSSVNKRKLSALESTLQSAPSSQKSAKLVKRGAPSNNATTLTTSVVQMNATLAQVATSLDQNRLDSDKAVIREAGNIINMSNLDNNKKATLHLYYGAHPLLAADMIRMDSELQMVTWNMILEHLAHHPEKIFS